MNNTMKKWYGVNIEDYGGYTSPEYRKFEKDYKNLLKMVATEIGGKLDTFNGNHYCFSAVFERNGKYAYLSISDVRYWNGGWHKNILIRTMAHNRDWTGGSNNYTDLEHLVENLLRLFK